jgi:hypothetical protein
MATAAALLAVGSSSGPLGRAEAPPAADLALVLAVDCSQSVDAGEYAIQSSGLAQAFAHPAIAEAIRAGSHGRIAVTLIQWSGKDDQRVVVPWTVVGTAGEVRSLAAAIAAAPRHVAGGSTSISAATAFALGRFGDLPVAPTRRAIDISSDGINNDGAAPEAMRPLAVAAGVTINALVIRNEAPRLDAYFRYRVISGDDSFVMAADDYDAYPAAILRKLVREISRPTS